MMEEQYAFCSGQCQASRFPPVNCRCICGGRNHGILRHSPINVTPRTHDERFNAWMDRFAEPTSIPQIAPLKQLPHIQPKPVNAEPRERLIFPVARGTKRFLKKITGIRTQDDLNQSIVRGLRTQFNQEHTEHAIDQAFSIFYSKEPDANRPELYELYESGHIDTALEMFGKRWVIGRPRVKR